MIPVARKNSDGRVCIEQDNSKKNRTCLEVRFGCVTSSEATSAEERKRIARGNMLSEQLILSEVGSNAQSNAAKYPVWADPHRRLAHTPNNTAVRELASALP